MNELEARQADNDTIKAHLVPMFVMEHYGHEPATEETGRVRYHSPFREDKNPSFDVFQMDGAWRVGDWADPDRGNGDVLDLISWFEDCDYLDALDKARDLLVEQLSEGYEFSFQPSAKFDADSAQTRLDQATAGSQVHELVIALSDRPGLRDLTAAWLSEEWGVVADSSVILPYLSLSGSLVGYKTRDTDGTKRNAPGSTLGLYGAHRIKGTGPIVLCEGETDTWAATLAGYQAVGVPGANNKPHRMWEEQFNGRDVLLAFDGDEAGDSAREQWAAYLADKATVRYVSVPRGKDLAELAPEDIRRAVDNPMTIKLPPEGFDAIGDRYYSTFGKEPKELSDWVFEPTEVYDGEHGRGYVGTLLPDSTVCTLSSRHLRNKNSLVLWCGDNGVSWFGTDGDVQRLGSFLSSKAHRLPPGRITSRAGLHDGDFVLPALHLGVGRWHYEPGVTDVTSAIHIREARNDVRRSLQLLLDLRDSSITGPILAWLACAPLRPLFPQFPFLNVAGASGSGKTATMETVVPAFTGTYITTNITGTTPHAIVSFFESTNALPIVFDEYRPGAREDGKRTLDQALRDGYNGARSAKGGGDDPLKLKYYRADAPVVVAGEESLVETSHIERAILLYLTNNDHDPDCLRRVQRHDYSGFAYTYLNWLINQQPHGERAVDPIVVPTVDLPGLSSRQAYNVGVLQYGWRALQAFVDHHAPGYELPDLDLSMVLKEYSRANASNPVKDVLNWLINQDSNTVWADAKQVYVDVQQLLVDAKRAGVFTLPGHNAATIERILEESYGAINVPSRAPDGSQKYVHVFERKHLD